MLFIENPTQIAIDWVTSKVYVGDKGGRRIEVATYDGSLRAVLLWKDIIDLTDLALDPDSMLEFKIL